jgi:hypothetical protein
VSGDGAEHRVPLAQAWAAPLVTHRRSPHTAGNDTSVARTALPVRAAGVAPSCTTATSGQY